jgi:hypothetical protein
MAELHKWEPTENQQAVLTAVVESDCTIGLLEVCATVGVSHQAYYKWFQTPGFVAWWDAQIESWASRKKESVYGALINAANRSTSKDEARYDTAAIKLYMERFDDKYKPASRSEITGANGGPLAVNLAGMSDLELERMAHAIGDETPASRQIEAKPAELPAQEAPRGTISNESGQQDGGKRT